MKKNILAAILAISTATFLSAQVTLTSAIHGIIIGDNTTDYKVDTVGVNPGSAGLSQTWNFSTITILPNPATLNYVNPSTTPYFSSFPTSTVAVAFSPGYFGYYNSTASTFELMGVANSTATLVNSNVQTFMNYPFSYSNSFSDNFYSAYLVSTTQYVRDGVDTVTADGSGTLILPSGSYPVLREKIVQVLRDSSATYVAHYKFVTYQWYSATNKFPLFTLTFSTTTVGSISTYSKSVTINSTVSSIDQINQNNLSISLFPNPTTQSTNLNFSINEKQQINILVSDLEGRTIANINRGELSPGDYTEIIDVSILSKGIYFIKVQGEKSSGTQKLIVQ